MRLVCLWFVLNICHRKFNANILFVCHVSLQKWPLHHVRRKLTNWLRRYSFKNYHHVFALALTVAAAFLLDPLFSPFCAILVLSCQLQPVYIEVSLTTYKCQLQEILSFCYQGKSIYQSVENVLTFQWIVDGQTAFIIFVICLWLDCDFPFLNCWYM